MKIKVSIFVTIAIILTSIWISPTFAETQISVTIDMKMLNFDDAQPTIIEGRTMVPLRSIFEALGASVEWNNTTKTVTATKGSKVIIMQIGSKSATIDGVISYLDVPGIIINGRTMVPIRFISENFDATVDWIDKTRTIAIITKDMNISAVLDNRASFCDLNKPYDDANGLTIILSSIGKIEKADYYEYKISYVSTNNTAGKTIPENTFRIWMSNLENVKQYGFFDTLYPGDSKERTYTFKVLKTQEPKILEFGGDFLRRTPETTTPQWNIGDL